MVKAKETKGGGSTAATWFLRGGVTGTLEVTSTPKSALANLLQNLLKSVPSPTGGRTKGLKQGNPFRKEGCAFKGPRLQSKPQGLLWKNGIDI
jgi:hypothetical protein